MAEALGNVVLGIFPHPEDEAYSAGGVLAGAAARGARAYVLCATRGERGQWFHRRQGDQRSLAQVRSEELGCSCTTLGVEPPRFLELEDMGLADVDFPIAVAELVREIRGLRPDVVITLGADGAYGHPDHVALHRLVVAAVRSAAGGDRFPEHDLGASHAIKRLLFCAFPAGLFRVQYERMLTSELARQMRLVDPGRLGVAPAQIDVAVPIAHAALAKLAAIACHRSQYGGDDPRSIFPPGLVDQLLAFEYFTISEGRPSPAPLVDIFQAIPS